MKRTQIYIDEDTLEYLRRESRIMGVTISELIRQTLRGRKTQSVEKILSALDSVSGIWKNRRFDPERYIRALRRDRTP